MWPGQSWSSCWGRTQWQSPSWWSGCQTLPECRREAQQPASSSQSEFLLGQKLINKQDYRWGSVRQEKPTLLPSGLSTTNTSFQSRIPVVSLSQPPLQLNPVRGSSSPPIHESLCCRRIEGEKNEKGEKYGDLLRCKTSSFIREHLINFTLKELNPLMESARPDIK